MKIFKSYSAGLVSAAKSKRMTTLIYSVTLLLALVIAIPFHSVLIAQAGNTMALSSLVKHFDYTSYTDFMRQSGKAIRPFLLTAVWMGFFFLLFTIFFTGGVLTILTEENKFTVKDFLTGCGKYFMRFLRLAVYIIIIISVIEGLLIFVIGVILAAAYTTVQSEASLFYIFLVGTIIGLLFLTLFLTISDYAKVILFREDSKKVLKSMWTSTKFVLRHFFGAFLLYLLLLIAPVVFFILYFLLDESIGMISGFTIFIMFLIQQVLIWLRTWVKIWFLGSELTYFDLIQESKKLIAEKYSPVRSEEQAGEMLGNPQVS